MTTDVPAPTLAGQSPGLGDGMPPGGGGGGGGGGGDPGAADDDPQPATLLPIPIANMVRSMTEPPTARPTDARKSRLAIRGLSELIVGLYTEPALLTRHAPLREAAVE
jgi:hypothetical protein